MILTFVRETAMPLPGGLQNSHENGGQVFLIFVADPRTVRLCMFGLPSVSGDVIGISSQIRVLSSEVVGMPFDRRYGGSPPPTRVGHPQALFRPVTENLRRWRGGLVGRGAVR